MAKHTRERKHNPKVWAIVLGILAFVLLAILVAAILLLTSLNRSADQVFTQPTTVVPTIPPAPEATPRHYDDIVADWIAMDGTAYNYRDDVINMLFIGVDYMSKEKYWYDYMTFNGGNSDVLILASLDTRANTLSILEIPRDTMMDLIMLDEYGNYADTVYTNISAAHSYSPDQKIGCELTADAVSRLLCGIPIHRYVSLSYDAIKPLNQLLGGVELTFDRDYTDIDSSFTEGSTVTLTDDQLRNFIQYRDTSVLDSAMDRSSRHIFLMHSLYDTCKSAFMQDITFPVRLYNGVKEHITTSLSIDEITYLARQVFEAEFHASDVAKIPGELTEGELYAEYYADTAWIESYVAEKLSLPVDQ